MLAEYVLLPCIFDQNHFADPEICYLHLKNITNTLIHEEALVRDLCNGKWRESVNKLPSKHPNTNYILKSLAQRLRCVRSTKAKLPKTFGDWCEEALSSYRQEIYNGIIASKDVANQYETNKLVASIEKLDEALWWKNRSHSVGLHRNTSNYLKHLKLILNHANSIMFIDPYFDPIYPSYGEFHEILKAVNRPKDPPDIEIHLCHLKDSISKNQYEQEFRTKFSTVIQAEKLKVDVFIWDKFHDRFIITDIIGIQSGHSFSISEDPKDLTTWTRIGRSRKDEVQKEFAKNSTQHKLQHRFTVD